MLTVAKEKAKKKQQTQIQWQTGNAMALSFPDEHFDYVTIGFGLRNVADRQQVLAEIHRVLRPGGKIVCLETSQPTLIGWRQLFTFYFHHVMPLFGKLFAKSYQEYSWLQESARDFPDKEALKREFQTAGFDVLQVKSYAGGAAAMHLGVKPLSEKKRKNERDHHALYGLMVSLRWAIQRVIVIFSLDLKQCWCITQWSPRNKWRRGR